MSKISLSSLNGRLFARSVKRWAQAARDANTIEVSVLRRQRMRARQLKTHLDKLIHTADARLALPLVGSPAFPTPHNSDWAWRPELWRGPMPTPGMSKVRSKSMFGDEITVFHDCAFSELTLRQLRYLREEQLAPYALRMEVFQFDGSFLSLAIDLPTTATDGLKRTHILRLDAFVELEKPIEIFARLNIKHGPNTEQIVRELPGSEQSHCIEFDLAYANLNEKQVERAWIDLIFEGPQMNQVTLRDLTFSRRPRAHL